MIVIWTAAKTDTIRKTIGASLKAFRPEVPQHRFEPIEPGAVPQVSTGELLLACGVRALEALQAAGVVPKNRTLNSLREHPVKLKSGGFCLLTFDPAAVNSEPEKRALIDWDLRLAHRLLSTGRLDPEIGDYRWVASLQPMIDRIEARFAKAGEAVDVSMDTETMGLYPWFGDKQIITIGFTDRAGYAELVYLGPKADPVPFDPATPLLDQIDWLLTSPKVKLRGANLKYDLVWIAQKWGIECTNFKFDTCLVGSLLDEARSNSLNLHAKTLTPIGGYDDALNHRYDKNHMEEIPLADLLPYAGGDIDSTYRVADVMRDALVEDGKLARFYVKVHHPAARAFEKIERRGLIVDQHKFETLKDDLQVAIKDSRKAALDLLPARLRIKHKEKIADQLAQGKSPLTAAVLKDFFFGPAGLNLTPKMITPKSGEPSTARAHLRMFAANANANAMCASLEELGSAEKTLSTFVIGFLKHLRPDGRLHPTYMLHHGDLHDSEDEESGSVTGRTACRDPAFQTVPKKTKWAKRLRECYPAPKGKLVAVADYSQGELKIVACVAPEPTMLAAYKQGLDLHAVTGAKLGGHTFSEFQALKATQPDYYDLVRTKAKPANFGLCVAEGQLVLTNEGLVPIERVQAQQLLWDGLEWVTHAGVVFRGYKPVETYDGVTATIDHEVWTSDGRKIPLWRAASEGVRLSRAAVGTQAVRSGHVEADRRLFAERSAQSPAYRRGVRRMCKDVLLACRQYPVRCDHELPVPKAQEIFRRSLRNAWSALRRDGAEMQARHARLVSPIQGPWHRSALCVAGGVYTLGISDVSGFRFQGLGLRSDEQRWPLRTRESEAGNKVRKSAQQVRVYDILNAGPRRRFTCEGRLVSNCYSMSAGGFQAYCWAQYGLALTAEEAVQMRDAFFELYPGLLKYHEDMRAFAKAHRYVRSPLGRVRHLETIDAWDRKIRSKAERQSINSPIQSALTDMMGWAIAEVDRQLPEDKIAVVGMIHDALVAYVDAEEGEYWLRQANEIMATLPLHELDWTPQLQFTADGELGPDLAHLKKLADLKVAV